MNTVRRDENIAQGNLYLNSLHADSPGMFSTFGLWSIQPQMLSSNW